MMGETIRLTSKNKNYEDFLFFCFFFAYAMRNGSEYLAPENLGKRGNGILFFPSKCEKDKQLFYIIYLFFFTLPLRCKPAPAPFLSSFPQAVTLIIKKI
jgi:hypothetical protein